MKPLRLWMVAAVFCCLGSVVKAEAAATVTVTQASEGVYSVSVANVVNAAAIDFTINYDAEALRDPLVNDGELVAEAAAFRELNAAVPGQLRVVYLSSKGFKKPGKLATVVFTRKGSLAARPPKLESSIVSSEGASVAVQPIVTPPAGTTAASGPAAAGSSAAAAGQIRYNNDGMGNLTGGTTVSTSVSSEPAGSRSPFAEAGQENAAPAADAALETAPEASYGQSRAGVSAEETPSAPAAADGGTDKTSKAATVEAFLTNLKTYQSVAERFRTHRGERTLKALSELFDFSMAKKAGLLQTPRIAVSDGKQTVNVKVVLPPASAVPSFSLKGANLKGIGTLSDKMLELDILPQKGKQDVRLSIVFQKEVAQIPLLVVPPLAAALQELSDPDLEKLLLKADNKIRPLPYDLNSDGQQDYLDDYILLAHWQLKRQQRDSTTTKPAKTVPPH